MQTILPFSDRPGDCLSVGPSQGLVYTIDSDIVIKVPFQYPVTVTQKPDSHLLDLSLKSFISLEKELAVYAMLKSHPHTNIARRLETDQLDCLFLERLIPLEVAWPHSAELDRRRWALELLDAVSWLEEHGWADGDLAIRNLGVDSTNRLKVFDFGSAINNSHPDYANDITRDHFDLATCLNYILSGVDPFATARSYSDVKKIRTELIQGRYRVGQGAQVLAEIIQGGWTGRGSSTGFSQLLEQASDILGPLPHNTLPEHPEIHYKRLESRCRDWLRKSSRNVHWKNVDGYLLSCKFVGHEADLDIWR
ncbi:kinase domain containing protein [Fusarium austroafricanum]|uniref:Kinase domain containing protein n=1 Tax=Fusarium austroafricanum TaxID=2364996 RepID=A0A8H4NS57_9HYPO|nr:kinase domain containing protein [Fusarium austroafricanum]